MKPNAAFMGRGNSTNKEFDQLQVMKQISNKRRMTIASKGDFLATYKSKVKNFVASFGDSNNLLDTILLNNSLKTNTKQGGFTQKSYTLNKKNQVLTELFKSRSHKGSKLTEDVSRPQSIHL